jgi:predicted nucleic acid-binding protein
MRLYLDACTIIYAFEGVPQIRNAVLAKIEQAVKSSGGILITSRLSRLECRVKPLRDRQTHLIANYDNFLSGRSISLCDISAAIIDRATELRALHNFKTPDAIHLATAMETRADVFLTGDAALARCTGLSVDVI